MKHSVFSTCGALSFIACAAVAQTPQYTLETSAADSVPQTTIVPVQQAPVQVVEHTDRLRGACGGDGPRPAQGL